MNSVYSWLVPRLEEHGTKVWWRKAIHTIMLRKERGMGGSVEGDAPFLVIPSDPPLARPHLLTERHI